MAEWKVIAEITVTGRVEAATEEEAIAKATAGIVAEMEADVGSYDGTPEAWLASKVDRAIDSGNVEAYEEDAEE